MKIVMAALCLMMTGMAAGCLYHHEVERVRSPDAKMPPAASIPAAPSKAVTRAAA